MKVASLIASLSFSLLLSVGAIAEDHSWDIHDEQTSHIFPWMNAPSPDLDYENASSQVSGQALPVINFRFSCDVLGLPQIQDVASSQPILGEEWSGLNLSTHCNYNHNGVTSKNLLQSEKNIATLRQWFLASNATGYSLELWMTPNVQRDLSVTVPVFVIGNHKEDDSLPIFGCEDTELYVGIRSNLLEIRYVDNDPEQSCRVLLLDSRPLKNDEVVQIVLTMNHDEAIIYLNGEPAMSATNHDVVTNMTAWDQASRLKLFSNQTEDSSPTTLYQVSLYDQLIEAEQVQWGYQQELSGKQDTLLEHEPVHLVALEKAANVVQGTVSPFEVGGWNASTSDYEVAIEILSLPPAGTILGDDGPISGVGSRIQLPKSSKQTILMYRAKLNDYFTSPGFSYSGKDLDLSPDIFEFRLVALDRDDGSLVGWSETVMKEITIQHVNQPAILVLPKVAKLAEVTNFNKDGPIATIEDVDLQDPDLNVDLIRVDIWTYNGTIIIENHVALADFEFHSNSSRVSWHSHGNPEGSQNMTFVAEPDDVSLVLSSIRYEGFHWGQEDTVTIRVYDGVGGPCLNEGDRKYDSMSDDCFKILANVSVPAVTWSSNNSTHGDGVVSRFNILGDLLLVLFSLCCVLLFLQIGFRQLRRMRYWKERETGTVNQGTPHQEETSDSPELEIVDFA